MARKNSNAGSGTDGGGIQHGGRAQTGMGDTECQRMECELHKQWSAYVLRTSSRDRRTVRRHA